MRSWLKIFTQGKLKFKSTLISVYNHVLSPYFTSPTHRCYEPITFYFRVYICYYYIRDIRRPEPLSFCSANITSLLHYSAGTKIISFIMTLSHICIVVPRPSSHLRYPSILSLAPSSLQMSPFFLHVYLEMQVDKSSSVKMIFHLPPRYLLFFTPLPSLTSSLLS